MVDTNLRGGGEQQEQRKMCATVKADQPDNFDLYEPKTIASKI